MASATQGSFYSIDIRKLISGAEPPTKSEMLQYFPLSLAPVHQYIYQDLGEENIFWTLLANMVRMGEYITNNLITKN